MLWQWAAPRRLALLATLSFLAIGCENSAPTAPDSPTELAAASDFGTITGLKANGSDLNGQYVVLMKANKRGAFQAKVRNLGGSVLFSHKIGLAVVTGLSEAAAAELGKDKAVTEMYQDASFQIDPNGPGVGAEAAAGTIQSPTDPTEAYFYPRQWNMTAIGADEAWALGRTGSPGITVAILDTGIDYTYPDLQGRVDLTRSISFQPNDDALAAFFFPGKHPVTDLHFHGTHVASTVVSNGSVVAGVTSQVTLMGVKTCDVYGACALGPTLAGVLFAADNGADVINMSIGGYFPKPGFGWYVGLINKVFNYARSRGATVVVSAGNEAIDLDHDSNGFATYCSAPGTLCVSATGPTASAGVNGPWENVDSPSPYTNFGRSAISVAAPGGTFDVPVWSACSQTSLQIPVCGTGNYVIALDGTSMAAPHVAGLAALVVEDVGRNPGRVKTIIQRGADDLGQRGTDPFYGKGRINVPATIRH